MINEKRLNVLPDWIKRVYSLLLSTKLPQRVVFISISLFATLWFLMRVIPKPSRATYPCMQIAAPYASSLVLWLFSIGASWVIIKKTRAFFTRRINVYVALFLSAICASIITLIYLKPNDSVHGFSPWFQPNVPVGKARGINPGRVVWAHNPDVIEWDGRDPWYSDNNINQQETDKMVFESLTELTGETTVSNGWNALFHHFNNDKNNTNKGYTPGEKICIKVNNNCTESQANSNAINTSPQLILSVLRTLINEAGVPQVDITVTDPSRFFQDYFFNKLDNEFPNVRYEDNIGGNGRDGVTYEKDAIPFSIPNGTNQTGIAKSHVDATYLINMAILKGHSTSVGVTLCGKNWFGSTSIQNHWSKNSGSHYNFGPNKDGSDKFLTFTDFLGHQDLGGKTILFMIEAIHGTRTNSDIPNYKWKMAPFNNDWPSSLFVSQDGVAIDAVGMDFFLAEFPNGAMGKPNDLMYCDKYLEEAAKIPNAPSGTIYDPERDGIAISKSLGVLEHWNNAVDKQYSRNLDPEGLGIELSHVFIN